ncbi:hypothetical protein [Mycobacterium deserti]|uniref:Uncharacterized protein n=1 Tax=Mycobacterium deserti TaxID=2978347 RepID=A0ABT2MB66_9MYCO|nr:hypothetical protein [Mycobacterium deserti]MCT7659512.1 hypothetical protein [Mycobacterium deserti]
MLSAIAIVPSTPVMIAELARGVAAEVADLREAAVAAAAALPARWVAVGVGPAQTHVRDDRTGTFAGYGVDIRVTLSPTASGSPSPMPLCALIAGWLRCQSAPQARAEVRVYAADYDVDAALASGRQLRAELDAAPEAVGLLIVADGANTLTPPAPGGYDPASIPVQAALDDALAAGDITALTHLPEAIVGRAAYQVLAGVGEPRSAEELYRGAPYGVGYFVGVWLPVGSSEATGVSTR